MAGSHLENGVGQGGEVALLQLRLDLLLAQLPVRDQYRLDQLSFHPLPAKILKTSRYKNVFTFSIVGHCQTSLSTVTTVQTWKPLKENLRSTNFLKIDFKTLNSFQHPNQREGFGDLVVETEAQGMSLGPTSLKMFQLVCYSSYLNLTSNVL